ncbi:hypothetical protein D3C85_1549670 [compost metagenome]
MKAFGDAGRIEGGFVVKIDSELSVIVLIERCLPVVFIQEDFDGILLPYVCTAFVELCIADLDQHIQILVIP